MFSKQEKLWSFKKTKNYTLLVWLFHLLQLKRSLGGHVLMRSVIVFSRINTCLYLLIFQNNCFLKNFSARGEMKDFDLQCAAHRRKAAGGNKKSNTTRDPEVTKLRGNKKYEEKGRKTSAIPKDHASWYCNPLWHDSNRDVFHSWCCLRIFDTECSEITLFSIPINSSQDLLYNYKTFRGSDWFCCFNCAC